MAKLLGRPAVKAELGLIDQGGLLDLQIKELQASLKQVKKDLQDQYGDEKQTLVGSMFVLTITPQKETKIVEKAFKKLPIRKQLDCCEPSVTLSRKVLTPEEMEMVSNTKPGTPRISFSKIAPRNE